MRPSDRVDVGDDRERRPVPVERLDTEGPLARKWGTIAPGASQVGCFASAWILVVRVVVGPYVRVLRSRLSLPWKILAFIGLGALYASIVAAVVAAPLPADPRLAR